VDGAIVLSRIERALNAQDLDVLVGCFDEQVVSEQPIHPSRSFRGRAQIEKNWSQLFGAFPDLVATLVRSVVDGNVAWAEWDWRAHRSDGGIADMRGVTLLGLDGDRITWVRFYMEPVEQDGSGIDAAIRKHVGRS
jgi:ketosteroid isomerase-like protein